MDKSNSFEPAFRACNVIRQFVRTVSGWEAEEDAVEALAAVGLLERVVGRLDGDTGRVLRSDGGKLDAAIDEALRPADRPEIIVI